MAEPALRRLTFAEYLDLERGSAVRHEFLDGEILAMAGGSRAHAQLAARIIARIDELIGDRPCRVFSSDLRVRVPATGLATYPDVTVVCGEDEVDPEDSETITNPLIVVEVLSDTTEAWDRGGKFRHYRKLHSLRHYLLVDQHARHIDHYTRGEDGAWLLRGADTGERVSLLDGHIEVDAVYRNVKLTPAPPRAERSR